DQVLWQIIELQSLDVSQRLSRLQTRDVRNCSVCSDIKEDFVASQHTGPSVVQDDFEGFGRYETTAAHDQFSATRLVLLQVRRNLTLYHLAFAPTDRCHIDRDGPGHHSLLSAVTRKMPLHDGGPVP